MAVGDIADGGNGVKEVALDEGMEVALDEEADEERQEHEERAESRP